MDPPPSPLARAERSFWTVWNYITEVVGRFLRPVATDIRNNDNDTSSGQERTADREADNCSDKDGDISGGGGEDEKKTALATASVVNSPLPVVAWEQPTIVTGSGPEKEDGQYAIAFSRGSDSHASEEGEGMTEEQVALTEDKDTEEQVALTEDKDTEEQVALTGDKDTEEQVALTEDKDTEEQVALTEDKDTEEQVALTGDKDTEEQVALTEDKDTEEQVDLTEDKDTEEQVALKEAIDTEEQVALTEAKDTEEQVALTEAIDTEEQVALTEDKDTEEQVDLKEDKDTKEQVDLTEDKDTEEQVALTEAIDTEEQVALTEDKDTEEQVDLTEDKDTEEQVDLKEDKDTEEQVDLKEAKDTEEQVALTEAKVTEEQVDLTEDKDTEVQVALTEDKDTEEQVALTEDKDTEEQVALTEDKDTEEQFDLTEDKDTKEQVGLTEDKNTEEQVALTEAIDTEEQVALTENKDTEEQVDLTEDKDTKEQVDLTEDKNTEEQVALTEAIDTEEQVDLTEDKDTKEQVDLTEDKNTEEQVALTEAIDTEEQVTLTDNKDTEEQVDLTEDKDTKEQVDLTEDKNTEEQVALTEAIDTEVQVAPTEDKDTEEQVDLTEAKDTEEQVDLTEDKDTKEQVDLTEAIDTEEQVDLTEDKNTEEQVALTEAIDTEEQVALTENKDTEEQVDLTEDKDTKEQVDLTEDKNTEEQVALTEAIDTEEQVALTENKDTEEQVDLTEDKDTKEQVDLTEDKNTEEQVALTEAIDTEEQVALTEDKDTEEQVDLKEDKDTEEQVDLTENKDTEEQVALTEAIDTEEQVALTEDKDTKEQVDLTEDKDTKEQVDLTEDKNTEEQVALTEAIDTEEPVDLTEDKDTEEQVDLTEDKDTEEQVDITKDKDTEEQVALTEAKDTEEQVALTEAIDTEEQVDITKDKDTEEQVDLTEDKDTEEQVDLTEDKDTEEQVDLTEDKETGWHFTQDVSITEDEEMDENNDEDLHLFGKDEIKIVEPDEPKEHTEQENITRSPSISDAALSEDTEEMVIHSRCEEETDRVMIPIPADRKVDEAMITQFQAKDGEETKEALAEDELGDLKDPYTVGCSEVEEKAGTLRMFEDMSPEEDSNVYVEDLRRQRKEEDGGLTYEAAIGEETERRDGVLELTSEFPIAEKEKNFKPDASVEPVAEVVQEPLLICKEVSFEDSAAMGGPGIVASEAALHSELHMAYDKRGIVSVDEMTVIGQEQMMGEGIESIENNKVEDQHENEDRSIVVEMKEGIENEEENDREEEVITNKILNTVIEPEVCLKAVGEDSKEEHMITEHVSVCERVTEVVEIELHRAGFKDGDRDDETEVLETVTKASEEDAFEKKSAEVSGLSVNLGTMIAKETELTGIAVSIDERFDDIEEDKIEEETVSSKEGETVSNMEETLAPIVVTVQMESNNRVEVSGKLKDISPGICVGSVVVPGEPGSVACDETQEEVPEYNNGHEQDEDATQRILEAGDYDEIGTTQLPEKLESEELESLENIVGHFTAGHLLVSERKEEEQDSKSESTEHIEKNLDMVVGGQTEKLCFTDIESPRETEKQSADPVNDKEAQVSGRSFVAEVGPLAASVRTEPRQSENASESGPDSVDETQGTEDELRDNTEEPLVDLGLDEELTDSTEPEAGDTSSMEDGPEIEIDVQSEKTTAAIEEDVVGLLDETVDSSETELKNTTEAGLLDESMDAEASEEKVAPEGIVETTLMEHLIHTGPKLLADKDLQDREIETQDARFEMEGIPDSGTVEKAAENESDSENYSDVINLQTVETSAGLFKENNGIENALIVAPEPPRDDAELSVESVETKHELSEKPLQTSNQEKITDAELCDESMEVESEPEDEVVISKRSEQDGLAESMIDLMGNYAEETGKPAIGHGNETDDEILDMWIETVLSEDRDDAEPNILRETTEEEPVEESEPGLPRDIETPPSDEGPDEKPSEPTEEEQLVEPSTEEQLETESGSVSEAEISETSPSAESGFSDQSIGELDPPENEAQLLKFAGSGLFQGILETADSVSETAETLISDLSAKPSETEDRSIEQTGEAGQSYVEEDQFAHTIPVQGITQTGFLGKPTDTTVVLSEAKHNESAHESLQIREPEKVETETGLRKEIIPEISNSGLSNQTDRREAKGTEAKSPTEMDALFRDDLVEIIDERLEKIVSNIPNEIQESYLTPSNETEETDSVLHREGSEPEALLGERVMSKESGLLGDSVFEYHNQLSGNKVHLLDKAQRGWSEETDGSLPGLNREETTEALLSSLPRTISGDQIKVDASILDFTPQKSRIAVKNPHVRPPKDPRSLLQMPSVEPSPPKPSGRLPIKGLAVMPMGGLGMGIKLPGLGVGFPVLKKTQRGVRDEHNTESLSQKSETEAEIKDESPKEEVERKPKWMPPRHPGFGNPLMSELKTKLKKTTKE